MAQIAPMVGGNGVYSYSNNSRMQRDGFMNAKDAITEALFGHLEIEKLLPDSKTITIADLGCSVGPNTVHAMQTLIDVVQHTHQLQALEFQVFFNDVASNDFNTLFTTLARDDDRKYFAAGVPGSFYDRLFPSSSIHLALSASSLHWMSRVPKELLIRGSPAWNAGRIHYTGASDAVVKAYAEQFEADMEIFLRARAQEIVRGGMMIILIPGVSDEGVTIDLGIVFTFIESLLIDMVQEGLLSQAKVDTFNIPHMYPSLKQMRGVVEKNGCFEIVKMELKNYRANSEALNIESEIMHLRALAEETFASHFGSEIVSQLFERAIHHKTKLSQMLCSSRSLVANLLLVVLKHK